MQEWNVLSESKLQFEKNEVVKRAWLIVNEQGYVNVTAALHIHIITKNNSYIAVHFPNKSKDPEVIPCTYDRGIISLTLGTEFSPVMTLFLWNT